MEFENKGFHICVCIHALMQNTLLQDVLSKMSIDHLNTLYMHRKHYYILNLKMLSAMHYIFYISQKYSQVKQNLKPI